MKNTINYYYNIRINELIKNNKDYTFYLNNEEYHFVKYNRPIEDIDSLYKLNIEMLRRNIIVHQIIINKDNSVVTFINGSAYVLLKLCNYNNDKIFLSDINYIQNMTFNIQFDKQLLRNDWVKLWCDKIDYYEYQINQLGKEYKILCDSLSYYIGLGENAISYIVNNIKNNNIIYTVSHKRINKDDGSFELFNPLNYIIDNRIRDISEYIKNAFFNDELNISELIVYLNYNNLSKNEYIYLYARLLFPTYYFDMYDEIINNKKEEERIFKIIDKVNNYEYFLINIYKYIVYEKKVQIEPIGWLLEKYS